MRLCARRYCTVILARRYDTLPCVCDKFRNGTTLRASGRLPGGLQNHLTCIRTCVSFLSSFISRDIEGIYENQVVHLALLGRTKRLAIIVQKLSSSSSRYCPCTSYVRFAFTTRRFAFGAGQRGNRELPRVEAFLPNGYPPGEGEMEDNTPHEGDAHRNVNRDTHVQMSLLLFSPLEKLRAKQGDTHHRSSIKMGTHHTINRCFC